MAVLILGIGYFGLQLELDTSSPFMLAKGISMEPNIHAGDILLNRIIPATDISVGDIVVFDVAPEHQERLKIPPVVAHRVIKIVDDQGKLAFVTKGDNSDIDTYEVPSSAIRGVVVKNLGPWGRPFQFLSNKSVLLLGGIAILSFIGITVAALSLLPKEPNEGNTGDAVGINQALENLASSVSEYGTHLQSHTAVVVNLGATTDELRQAAHDQSDVSNGLRQAVLEQNRVIASLKEAVVESPDRLGTNSLSRELLNRITESQSFTAESVKFSQGLLDQFTESMAMTSKPVKHNRKGEPESLEVKQAQQTNTNAVEGQPEAFDNNPPERRRSGGLIRRLRRQFAESPRLTAKLVEIKQGDEPYQTTTGKKLVSFEMKPAQQTNTNPFESQQNELEAKEEGRDQDQELEQLILRSNLVYADLTAYVTTPIEQVQTQDLRVGVLRLDQLLVELKGFAVKPLEPAQKEQVTEAVYRLHQVLDGLGKLAEDKAWRKSS